MNDDNDTVYYYDCLLNTIIFLFSHLYYSYTQAIIIVILYIKLPQISTILVTLTLDEIFLKFRFVSYLYTCHFHAHFAFNVFIF